MNLLFIQLIVTSVSQNGYFTDNDSLNDVKYCKYTNKSIHSKVFKSFDLVFFF